MPASQTVNNYGSSERKPREYKRQRVTVAGVEYDSLAAATRARGLDYQAVRHRLRFGVSADVAFGVEASVGAPRASKDTHLEGRVYKIVHAATGKVYVGRTSVKVGMRWRWHIHRARKAKKVNPLSLRAAILKFGEHAFEVSELATASSLEDAIALEARYIRELNSLAPHGFNLSPGDSAPSPTARKSVTPPAGSMRIGQLAAKAGCDKETVRYYEAEGLL